MPTPHDEALRALLKLGRTDRSGRSLATEWAQPTATVARWLKAWEKAGYIRRDGAWIIAGDRETPVIEDETPADQSETPYKTPTPVSLPVSLQRTEDREVARTDLQVAESPVSSAVIIDASTKFGALAVSRPRGVSLPVSSPVSPNETRGTGNLEAVTRHIRRYVDDASGGVRQDETSTPAVSPQTTGPAVQPAPLKLTLASSLSLFRPANGLRLVGAAAVAVSISMIAYHSATASAASTFHWWATLVMAVIISTGKVELGRQAEGFFADGARGAGVLCMLGAIFLLCVDASLLYAFRGDSLSNAAAQEKAAMETRQRLDARLTLLMGEQKRLNLEAGQSVTAASVRLVGEVEADLAALEHDRDCRLIQPRRRKGEPVPPKVPANEAACEKKRAALQGELTRAKDAAGDEARATATAEKREKRLAELPDLIAKAENELGAMQARATPDHGASIVARGLNWIPAGVSAVIWGSEVRPVEGRGVEIFWSWAFVLAAELFAVGGFAIAARADRKARKAA